MNCEYKVWGDNGELVSCEKEGKLIVVVKNKELRSFGIKRNLCLCLEHLAFVGDAIDRSEIYHFIDSLPNCDDCFNYFQVAPDENPKFICVKGKSNLPNWPFRHTKCKYFSGWN